MSHQAESQTADVDGRGNTLFHKDAVDFKGVEALDRLVALGIDVNQANNAGRTPLHALCSVGWYDIFLDDGLVAHTRWFLQHTTNIDAPDANGVRPLHLASMMSEYLVKELLSSGADPAGRTPEGMTPLHLAARARQSNIVGILINALQTTASTTSSSLSNLNLNARDKTGRWPLHYACRSGRHETVSLLLAAGADVHAQDDQGLTVLDACAEFDDEQLLWVDYRKPDKGDWETLALTSIPRDWNRDAAAGTGLHDRLRPWVTAGKAVNDVFVKTFGQAAENTMNNAKGGIRSCQDTTRLHEILRMLHQAQAVEPESSTSFIQNLGRCVQKLESTAGHTYTLRCFRDFAAEFSGTKSLHDQRDAEILESLFSEREKWNDNESCVNETMVEQLLRRREYGVIERLLRRASPLCSTPGKAAQAGKILRLFAKLGFAHLIAAIFESNTDTLEELLSKNELDGKPADPLLFLACQRELPNMDVMRLLVETGHVDVNARSRTTAQRAASLEDIGWAEEEDEPDPGQATALHELAAGRHWWGVTQAIPYLLSKGADRKMLNEAGQTPLKVAEEYLPRGPFETEAIEALRG
jgi:Ankyrin repeats (3 copies)